MTANENANGIGLLNEKPLHAALKEFEKARDAYSKSLVEKTDEKVKQKLDTLLPR